MRNMPEDDCDRAELARMNAEPWMVARFAKVAALAPESRGSM